MTTFGIWAGVYAGGVIFLFLQIAGKPISVAAIIGSSFLVMAVYVLHRMSPEQNDAMQQRHLLAMSKRRTMFFLFGLASTIAAGILYVVNPIFVFLLPIGCIAVLLYGRKSVAYPIRNMRFLKPLAVGCSIAVFGWVISDTPWPPLVAIGMVFVITADALLCDIQDVSYDMACGCTTLPATSREFVIWTFAFILNFTTACFLWFACGSNIGWMILVMFPTLFLLRKFDLRLFVDLRLPLVALIAWTV